MARIKMYRQFKSYNIRCRVCGKGKPKSDFQGTWRVCESCRKKEQPMFTPRAAMA